MGLWIKNANRSVSLSLIALRVVGFWAPDDLRNDVQMLYSCYAAFSFMFLLGAYLIIQVVDLFLIWGDLPLMTGTAFLLFTNLAQAAKIFNIILKRKSIQNIIGEANEVLLRAQGEEAKEIVKRCDQETRIQQTVYFGLTVITTLGWAASAEKNKLPLRAWYPYDTSKSPAYELTYVHQVFALFIAAYLNQMLTPDQEDLASGRLRACVQEHQAALEAAGQLQASFSLPTFAQFTVSLIIICVTAFQLVSQTGNMVRLVSMGTYLLNMCFQVFIYCYQGNQLSEESSEIAGAAYECPWYLCSSRFRRALLVVMVRSRRVARLTAGGFTTLSLASFMAIIKASYSLFTLLQQVEEKK